MLHNTKINHLLLTCPGFLILGGLLILGQLYIATFFTEELRQYSFITSNMHCLADNILEISIRIRKLQLTQSHQEQAIILQWIKIYKEKISQQIYVISNFMKEYPEKWKKTPTKWQHIRDKITRFVEQGTQVQYFREIAVLDSVRDLEGLIHKWLNSVTSKMGELPDNLGQYTLWLWYCSVGREKVSSKRNDFSHHCRLHL